MSQTLMASSSNFGQQQNLFKPDPDVFLVDLPNKDKLVDAQSPTAAWRASASQSEFVDDKAEDELDDSLTSLNWLHSMQGGIQMDPTAEVKKEPNKSENQNSDLTENRTTAGGTPNQGDVKVTSDLMNQMGAKLPGFPVKGVAKTATRAPPNRNKNLINVAAALSNAQNFVTVSPQRNNSKQNLKSATNENAATTRPLSQKPMSKKISITTIPAKREVTTIVNGNLGLTANMGLNRTVGLANRNAANSGGFVPAVLSRGGSAEGNEFVPYPMTNMGNNHQLLIRSTLQNFSPQLSTNAKGSDAAQLLDDPDVSKYKYNHLIKPPFSYTTLICMSMKARGASFDGKITLNDLLAWIADNFSYYKHSDPAWQNNVYHALATNKCFQKVVTGQNNNQASQQQQTVGVVGSFHEELNSGNSIWRIAPNHQTEVDMMFKKKRALQHQPSMINGTLKKARITQTGVIDANTVIQIGPNSQSAPVRSKRKQLVPEDHSNLARRSNSSGPMNSTVANQSPTMVQIGYNNPQQSNNIPSNCLPLSHSNRKFVTKQLMSNNSTFNQEIVKTSTNDVESIPVITSTQMVHNGVSPATSLSSQQKQNGATNKIQAQNRNIQQHQQQQNSSVKYSASAHDSVTQTVRALNEYVQGLQKSATSSQLADETTKPIAMKPQTTSQLVPVNSRSEVPPAAMSAPIYNVNSNGNNSSCSLPPLLGGGLAVSNGVSYTDNILGNLGPQSVPEYPDGLQFQEETLVTEQDCLLMNLTEDDILSQIDDLFFDISPPPQSNQNLENPDFDPLNGLIFDSNLDFFPANFNHTQAPQQLPPQQNINTLPPSFGFDPQQGQNPQTNDNYKNLAVRGSKIEPPLNWSPSPRNLLLQDGSNIPKNVKLEPKDPDLTASGSSWLQCSQTSLSLSNNSDWLRDSHERIMKGGQLSEEELELSGHGLATRAVLNQGKEQLRFVSQNQIPVESCQQQNSTIFPAEKMSNVQHLQLNESMLSQDSFAQFINSSNEFNSPRMLDLSCLPEPLA